MMRLGIRWMLVTCIALAAYQGQVWAEQQPQWEAGLGATALRLAEYRGADEFKTYVIPLPYFIYRGEHVKIDRDSIRGRFFKTDLIEFDISGNGAPPLKSKDNAARAGMADLDATFSIGPALNITLFRSPDRGNKLVLKLPVQAVVATDLHHFRSAGWFTNPYLNWDVKNVAHSGWNTGVLIGPYYHSQRYNDFLYGVAPAYATTSRPAYKAKSGYGGASLTAGVSKKFGAFWLGIFVRGDNLNGASFEDSPLVRKRSFVTGGIAASWVFAESKNRVEVDD